MFEDISRMIRAKKKGSLRPDMDSAGQEGVDPVAAWDAKQAAEVNAATGDEDHAPATATEMGEHESSQEKSALKKSMARINGYFDKMKFKD